QGRDDGRARDPRPEHRQKRGSSHPLEGRRAGMSLWEAVRTAWLEISSHKMRSFLSFFAITVGTAAILYTFAQIRGINHRMDVNLTLIGPGRINVRKKENHISKGLSPGLTSEDADEIRRLMPKL